MVYDNNGLNKDDLVLRSTLRLGNPIQNYELESFGFANRQE